MIITALLFLIFSILNFILGFIHLPAVPAAWHQAINGILPFFAAPVSVVRTYVGHQFFDAMIVMIGLAIVMLISVRPFMWLYNKIRGSGGGNS